MPNITNQRIYQADPNFASSQLTLLRYVAFNESTDIVAQHFGGEAYEMVAPMRYGHAQPRPLPQAVAYTEHDLQARGDHVKALNEYTHAALEGTLSSSLKRYTAIGGTVALTTVGTLIGVKNAAHAYKQNVDGQDVTFFTKPQ